MPNIGDMNLYSDGDDSSDAAGDEIIDEFRREQAKDEEIRQGKLQQQ